MIEVIWQSCCGERARSHINNKKTLRRAALGDGTCDDLIFNNFRLPNLHEINLK
jgi:hypothetical protein